MGRIQEVLKAAFGRKAGPSETVGVGGTRIVGGYIQSDETNARLTGTRKYKTFGDMIVNVDIVATGIRYFLDLISRPKWRVVPKDQSAGAKDAAELIESCLQDCETPWSRIVRRAGMHRFYGFAICEFIAKKRPDGTVGILDLERRPQRTIERWDLDEVGRLRGVWQVDPNNGREIYLPSSKILHFADDTFSDSPEGLGLLRNCVAATDMLVNYERLEGVGFETDLRGVPIGRAPLLELEQQVEAGTISRAQADAATSGLKTLVEKHGRTFNLGMLFDSATYRGLDASGSISGVNKWGLELINGGSTSSQFIGQSIERQLLRIARLLGVEHLMIGGSTSGSQALSRDKSTNYALVGQSTLDEIVGVVEWQLVPRLLDLNGIPQELAPDISTDKLAWRDIEQITGALGQLATAGCPMKPGDKAEGEVYELIGLSPPERDPDEDAADASLLPKGKERPVDPDEPTDDDDDEPEEVTKTFDPDQPRDDDGKWDGGGGGGSGAAPTGPSGGAVAATVAESFKDVKAANAEIKRVKTKLTGSPRRAANIAHLQRADVKDLEDLASATRYLAQHGSNNEVHSARAMLHHVEAEISSRKVGKEFDPSQPRDESGQWSSDGSASSDGDGGASTIEPVASTGEVYGIHQPALNAFRERVIKVQEAAAAKTVRARAKLDKARERAGDAEEAKYTALTKANQARARSEADPENQNLRADWDAAESAYSATIDPFDEATEEAARAEAAYEKAIASQSNASAKELLKESMSVAEEDGMSKDDYKRAQNGIKEQWSYREKSEREGVPAGSGSQTKRAIDARANGREFLLNAAAPDIHREALTAAAQYADGVRAYAVHSTRDDGMIGPGFVVLSTTGDSSTFVHEYGHQIEFGNDDVRNLANQFLERRVGSEPYVPMSSFRSGYGPEEKGRSDNFLAAVMTSDPPIELGKSRAAYIGKSYEGGSTEVLSMGMELMKQNAAGFAKADPEFFDFVAGTLTGRILNKARNQRRSRWLKS